MRVREVLGVDFCGDRLCAAQVRRDDVSGRPVLTRWASRTVPAGAESTAVAASLRNMLAEGGFAARGAVFGLPKGRGFLRCRGPGQVEAEHFSRIDYVTDGWTAADGREVLGVASRADVTRLAEIAAQAGLELLAVELRLMGCLTALGLLGESGRPGDEAPAGLSADKPTVLGLIVSEADVTLGLVDRGAVLSVQSRSRGAPSGQLDRWDSALAAAEKMARLAEMARPDTPADSARVIVNAADLQAARNLTGRLGMPVELVSPGADAGIVVEGGDLAEPADYAAAIGLALEGLEGSTPAAARGRRVAAVGRLNFLQAGKPPPRRWAPSRRHAVAAVAGAIVIVFAVFCGLALRKRAELSELQGRYDRLAGKLQQWRQAHQRIRAVGPWLAPAEDGQRVSQRRVYEAISDLFPSKSAYVHRAVIEPDQAGRGLNVRLDGRARRRSVLHEFVSKLNASPLFARASLGPVVEDSDESDFSKRFSVTLSLRESR